MDTKTLITLNVILYLTFGCANSKKPAQIEQSNHHTLSIISAKIIEYFPGTGIGKGQQFEIIVANNSEASIVFDSLQTKLHGVKFDGNPTIHQHDTLTINAFGLTIDHDLFPDIPKRQFKGDSTLADGGIIFYTQGQTHKTMTIKAFEKGGSNFYD